MAETQKIGTITGFCGEMDAARCYGNPVYIGYLVYSNSAILGVRFGELERVNLGAGAELVALEFQVKTASSEAEFASGA